ncbi:MAG: outer membrane homotrimeric porin [Desulfovibrio sp.]|nr:outer membrane homotrimeric porin [Desulfovibrio sp.]
MKKICTVMLAAAMLLGAASGASAIDFNAKGQWLMGFGVGETTPIKHANHDDQFEARQRVRLQMDAVASEALSGTVYFEIGTQKWGNAATGGALGADGQQVKVKRAYIDWTPPATDLKVRMGIQGLVMPNKAGGSAIMNTDVAAVVASYQFNDNAGLTAFWARPANDNNTTDAKTNWLDNIDLFSLALPLKFDGVEATPWVMYGIRGKNSFNGYGSAWSTEDGNFTYSFLPYPAAASFEGNRYGTDKVWGNMFWLGLPVAITMFDPLNIEFDINYGYSEKMGRYANEDAYGVARRGSTQRQGWLAKALVEYKMDWGVPGIFGWYASGDDKNIKNGSERMPSVNPMNEMTSFMGDSNYGWIMQDLGLDYSGTWGIGAQVRDMSFVEDLSHTLRVAYWGGTNAPGMAKYMANDENTGSRAWANNWGKGTSPYLTTKDGLLEINFINNYKMYENFDINFEASYIANFMNHNTWDKAGGSFSKQDVWKAEVIFAYSF